MLSSMGTASWLGKIKGVLEKGRTEGGDVMSQSHGSVFPIVERRGKSGDGGRFLCVCKLLRPELEFSGTCRRSLTWLSVHLTL